MAGTSGRWKGETFSFGPAQAGDIVDLQARRRAGGRRAARGCGVRPTQLALAKAAQPRSVLYAPAEAEDAARAVAAAPPGEATAQLDAYLVVAVGDSVGGQ